jgi:hypothetical protein
MAVPRSGRRASGCVESHWALNLLPSNEIRVVLNRKRTNQRVIFMQENTQSDVLTEAMSHATATTLHGVYRGGCAYDCAPEQSWLELGLAVWTLHMDVHSGPFTREKVKSKAADAKNSGTHETPITAMPGLSCDNNLFKRGSPMSIVSTVGIDLAKNVFSGPWRRCRWSGFDPLDGIPSEADAAHRPTADVPDWHGGVLRSARMGTTIRHFWSLREIDGT